MSSHGFGQNVGHQIVLYEFWTWPTLYIWYKLFEPIANNPKCSPTTWEGYNKHCCTVEEPCGLGEGDCDTDDECADGFVCGTNNCVGFPNPKADCCQLPVMEGTYAILMTMVKSCIWQIIGLKPSN